MIRRRSADCILQNIPFLECPDLHVCNPEAEAASRKKTICPPQDYRRIEQCHIHFPSRRVLELQ